jgi:hypothetical protein
MEDRMATKNNRHRKKPDLPNGAAPGRWPRGKRFKPPRLKDGERHPVTVRRIDPS